MHLTNSLTLCNTYSNLKEQSKVKNANCQTYSSPQILDTSSVRKEKLDQQADVSKP